MFKSEYTAYNMSYNQGFWKTNCYTLFKIKTLYIFYVSRYFCIYRFLELKRNQPKKSNI